MRLHPLDSSSAAPSIVPLCLVAIITFLGFALRAASLNFGLPYLYHADEPIVVNHALSFGSLDFNPHFFKIPPFTSYYLFFIYALYFIIGKLIGVFHSAADFEQLFYLRPTPFYLIGRFAAGVLPGTLSIVMLYRICVKKFGVAASLVSSFLLSVCFLMVRDSHYAYTDMLLTFTLICAFGFLFELSFHPEWNSRQHIVCGLMLGLSAAVKYNGAAIIIPYLALLTLAKKKVNFGHVTLYFCSALFMFAACNPFAFIDHKFFVNELMAESRAHGGVSLFHHLTYSLLGSMGLPLLLFSLLAVVAGISSKDPVKKMLSVFVISYYLIVVKAGQPYDRYVIPMIPFIFILSGDLICKIVSKFFRVKNLVWPCLLIAFFLCLPSIVSCLKFNSIMNQPDTRTIAKEWIESQIPPDTRIALGIKIYCPPLTFSKTALIRKREAIEKSARLPGNQLRRFQILIDEAVRSQKGYDLYFFSRDPSARSFLFSEPSIAYSIQALKDKRISYAVVPAIAGQGVEQGFLMELERNAELIKTISPYKSERINIPFDELALTGGPFLWRELVERKSNGVPIKVYKLQ